MTFDAPGNLFVALAMDTGWYRHSNTTPASFELGAKLVAAGAQPTAAYEQLFEQNSPGKLLLTGLVLSRLQVLDGEREAMKRPHYLTAAKLRITLLCLGKQCAAILQRHDCIHVWV